MAIAYQYDASGYYVGETEDYGFLPNNATYTKPPAIQKGLWPCWQKDAWQQVEDHRQRENSPDLVALFGKDFPQNATEFWLPEDGCDAPAHTMKEVGPLPDGASLTPPPKCFFVLKQEKYQEIIGGADAVMSLLSSRYSRIEEEAWAQQEAGARVILGSEADCKDETARAIIKDESASVRAVYLVEKLAEADGTDKTTFAQRIVKNADTAYQAGIKTLLEQRALEARLNAIEYDDSMSVTEKAIAKAQVEAIEVVYSVMG